MKDCQPCTEELKKQKGHTKVSQRLASLRLGDKKRGWNHHSFNGLEGAPCRAEPQTSEEGLCLAGPVSTGRITKWINCCHWNKRSLLCWVRLTRIRWQEPETNTRIGSKREAIIPSSSSVLPTVADSPAEKSKCGLQNPSPSNAKKIQADFHI